jgi:predicted HicB family RNase H-like nuclease
MYKYKGYSVNLIYKEDGIEGNITLLNEDYTFQASNIEDFNYKFRQAVEEYLVNCIELNRVPQHLYIYNKRKGL